MLYASSPVIAWKYYFLKVSEIVESVTWRSNLSGCGNLMLGADMIAGQPFFRFKLDLFACIYIVFPHSFCFNATERYPDSAMLIS